MVADLNEVFLVGTLECAPRPGCDERGSYVGLVVTTRCGYGAETHRVRIEEDGARARCGHYEIGTRLVIVGRLQTRALGKSVYTIIVARIVEILVSEPDAKTEPQGSSTSTSRAKGRHRVTYVRSMGRGGRSR